MTHVNPISNQTDFRFRVDSGNEATPTWLANANIDISLDVDTDFRYRTVVAETATSSNPLTITPVLYYSHEGGAYAIVTGATPVQFATFSGATDADTTTQQVGSGSFVAGELDDDGTVSNVDIQGSETEMEYCLTIDSAQVANDDTISLRTYEAVDTPLDNYGNTGTVTVIEAAPSFLAAWASGSNRIIQ